MRDSLLRPLMGEFSSHLHFMSSFLEGMWMGRDVNHVAGPGVYARQLVGVMV